MENLDDFVACNGPAIACRPISEASINAYCKIIPGALLEHWKQAGVCGYANGAFWITDPGYYAAYAQRIRGLIDPLVIARTAFGNLFLWAKGEMYFHRPDDGGFSSSGPRLAMYFNLLFCEDKTRNILWELALFRKAHRRLGGLAPDECYGYVPIPALGGSGRPDTLQKVKILPYLEILRQTVA